MRKRLLGGLTIWLAAVSLAVGQGRPGGPGFYRGGEAEGGGLPTQPNPLWPAGYPTSATAGYGTPPVAIIYGPLGGNFDPAAFQARPPQATVKAPQATKNLSKTAATKPATSKNNIVQTQAVGKKSAARQASFAQPGDEELPPDPPETMVNPGPVEEGIVEGDPAFWQAPRQESRPPIAPLGYRLYGRAEFLYWFVRDQPYRTLLQIGDGAAAINVPSNAIHFDSQERQGARMMAGFWLNPEQTMSLEAGGFILGSHDTHTIVGSGGTPSITIPYFDAAINAPFILKLAEPGISAQVDFLTVSRFWGAEGNFRHQLLRPTGPLFFGHLDALAGFRFAQLEDKLHMNAVNNFLGQKIGTSDRFDSVNSFYGFQVGLDGEVQFFNFFLNMWGKIALGGNQQDVRIAGDGFVTGGGTTLVVDRGVYAMPSNIGEYHPAHFAFLPEVGVNLGYQLTNYLRLSAGYSILWLTSTVRAADQMETVMNLTQGSLRGGPPLPPNTGPLLPVFQANSSIFWAHGLNVGLEFRY